MHQFYLSIARIKSVPQIGIYSMQTSKTSKRQLPKGAQKSTQQQPPSHHDLVSPTFSQFLRRNQVTETGFNSALRQRERSQESLPPDNLTPREMESTPTYLMLDQVDKERYETHQYFNSAIHNSLKAKKDLRKQLSNQVMRANEASNSRLASFSVVKNQNVTDSFKMNNFLIRRTKQAAEQPSVSLQPHEKSVTLEQAKTPSRKPPLLKSQLRRIDFLASPKEPEVYTNLLDNILRSPAQKVDLTRKLQVLKKINGRKTKPSARSPVPDRPTAMHSLSRNL